MPVNYKKLNEFLLLAGNKLLKQSQRFLTEPADQVVIKKIEIDLERRIKKLILNFDPGAQFFAEEEDAVYLATEDLWVIDPISSTFAFATAQGHFSLVATHLRHGTPVFVVVYDPSARELFTAYKGRGAFLNKKRIRMNSPTTSVPKIIFNQHVKWHGGKNAYDLVHTLYCHRKFKTYSGTSSFATNYCHVAAGRYDGIIALTNDTFTEYAGSLIIREAGGFFATRDGQTNFKAIDRIFIAGKTTIRGLLVQTVQNEL